MIADWEIALRLVAAAVLAGVIGYERQSHHKSAGLRTHILVAVGSCLIMVLSINIYQSVQGQTNADPTRLAAQVVSGIGFLGAGSILKEGPTIKGLTTAASLWVVSGVGLAVGSGYYTSALATTLLVFVTLTILAKMEHRMCSDRAFSLTVITIDTPGQLGLISVALGEAGGSIRDIKIEEQEHLLVVTFALRFRREVNQEKLIADLSQLNGVMSVKKDCLID
ncbi:MAG: MgtC/SapB family protein [Veillonellales bacterium]